MGSELTVIVWGDSIPASGPDSWPEAAEFVYNNLTNTGRPVKVINSSVGGKPAARARDEFEERVAKYNPDLVFIQFGFNDMRYDGKRGNKPISTIPEFSDHLRAMIEDCREIGAKVIVIGNHRPATVLTMPDGKTHAEKTREYNEAARQTAFASKAVYFDISEQEVPGNSYRELVCEDCVHLSEFGRHIYGQFAANLIQKYI
jgi:lysophospholipase L1-like esterase